MKRRAALSLPILGLLALLIYLRSDESQQDSSAPESRAADTPMVVAEPVKEFREWQGKVRDREAADDDLEAGIRIAQARKERMLEWMASDPARALAEAISRRDYAGLPEALKPYFEQPFNEVASLSVLPVCGPDGQGESQRIVKAGGKSYRASVTGRRLQQGSKEGAPLSGIMLDDRVVVREGALEKLSLEDARTLAQLPSGQKNPGRDYATGIALGPERITALAGGRLYYFTDEASLDEFNARLATLDDKPGPHGGSQAIFASPGDGGSGDGGFPWEEAENWSDELASAWTETPKKVLFIRVDFPDLTGQSVSDVELKGILNGPVATSISRMSYGKTTITADVSPVLVRLPQTTSYYRTDERNDQMHQDARNAYEALAGAAAVSGYDIIGLHFKDIHMSSGNVEYAGAAILGGSQTWIQGTLSFKTIIHELGHNYGAHHAGFWKTMDGTVLGENGTYEEYGDIFDMMGSGEDARIHDFGPMSKLRLNWITSAQFTSASPAGGSGIHRLYRFDHPGTTGANRVLRAAIPNSSDSYWIGYRAGIPDNPSLAGGAFVTMQRGDDIRTLLLDTTPGSVDERRDCALPLGITYSDPKGTHITPVARGGSGANAWLDVNVQIGSFAGNQSPVLNLNVPAGGPSRVPVTVSAGASDPNGDALSYFWDFGDGTTTVNAGSVPHIWVIGGTYTVKVTASDMRGRSASAQATITITDPLANWASKPLATAYETLDYLDGRFIAIGSGGFHFSADGVNWATQAAPGFSFTGREVAFDGEVYVAACAASNTLLYRSLDGRSWKPPTSVPTTLQMMSVTHGQGKFVMVGTQGQTLSSTDQGQTWQMSQIADLPNLMGVAYGNGIFVAVGVNSDWFSPGLYTSTDGVTWTSRSNSLSLPLLSSFYDVEFVNGTFYAVGDETGILRSTDGLNWQTTVIESSGNYEVRSVAAGPGFLIAGAENVAGQVFLVSLDGLTWTPGTAPSQLFLDPVWADGRFIAPGYQFNYTPTLDPGNRAPSASLAGPSACSARETVLFRAHCSDPDGDALTLIWDFNDGSPLERASACYHRFIAGGVRQVKLHVIDRRGGITTVSHQVTVSDPLGNWTQVNSATGKHLEAVAAGAGKIVAGGYPEGAFFVSSDGANWTPGKIGGDAYFTKIIHDGNQFVASGQDKDSSYKGAIFTSPDGSTWTRRYLGGQALAALAFRAGRYVAVGGNGTIAYSDDSITWNPVTSGTSGHLNGIAHGDGYFVAGGRIEPTRLILNSPDGLAWTNTTSGTGSAGGISIVGMRYLHDRFVANGANGDIVYSLDHGATFKGAGVTSREMSDFAYGNGVFFACGTVRNQSAPVNLVSSDGAGWSELVTPAQQDRTEAVFFNDRFYTVGLNGSIWRSGVVPVAGGTVGFAGWRSTYFAEGTPGSGPEDDFDGDGVPNLGEFATGSNPRNSTDRSVEASTSEGFFLLTVPKIAGAEEVVCHVECSRDLENWSEDEVEIVEDSPTRLVAKVPTASGDAYLRAIFTLD